MGPEGRWPLPGKEIEMFDWISELWTEWVSGWGDSEKAVGVPQPTG